MRRISIVALAASVSVALVGGAAAESLNLTPPLYREAARDTQRVRPAAELATVPSPVRHVPAGVASTETAGQVVASAFPEER